MARYATVIGFGVLVQLNMVIIWNNAETPLRKSTHVVNTLAVLLYECLVHFLPLITFRNCFVIMRISNRHFMGFNIFHVVEN